MTTSPIQIYSEIGRLRRVLVHRPGMELNNLVPDWMEPLLFDELPYLKVARAEHDAFVSIMKQAGIEVLYLNVLLGEVLAEAEVREALLEDFLHGCALSVPRERALLLETLKAIEDPHALALRLMQGTRRSDLPPYPRTSLSEKVADSHPFVALPMPNLYFTRDPFSFIGNGVALSHMWSDVRNRETLFGRYILKHHPLFKSHAVPFWYDQEDPRSIEGGDILVLNEETLAVGISQRTSPQAIEQLCHKLFADEAHAFRKVLAFNIPKKREFMHLDTVFTMVDKSLFTLHPLIRGPLDVYCLTPAADGSLQVEEQSGTLDQILSRHLGLSHVQLLYCGGDNPLDAAREQWNDGSNTLAIAPREVIVYDRNEVTNALLEDAGVVVHRMPSGELSRGRGGPRCMSMPLYRDRLR